MKRSALLLSLLLPVVTCSLAAEPHAAGQQHQNEHQHQHDDEHQDGFDALGAHTHGHGVLTVVLEGNEMQLAFESAAYSIVGFEHKPVSTEQQQEVAAAIEVFNQGQWFRFNAEASCELAQADASSDLTEPHANEGHADFYANYQLLCQSPARLTSVALDIFKLVPALEQVDVQWIINGQQGAAKATLSNSLITLR